MKQFIAVLFLFSLLVAPMASLAKKPNTVPPSLKGFRVGAKLELGADHSASGTKATSSRRGGDEDQDKQNLSTTATSTPNHQSTFVLTGEVVSVNASSSMLSVKVKTINQFALRRDLRGTTLNVQVDANTVIHRPGQKNATLADLAAGHRVTIKGKIDANKVFTATSIVATGKPSKSKSILNNLLNVFKNKKK